MEPQSVVVGEVGVEPQSVGGRGGAPVSGSWGGRGGAPVHGTVAPVHGSQGGRGRACTPQVSQRPSRFFENGGAPVIVGRGNTSSVRPPVNATNGVPTTSTVPVTCEQSHKPKKILTKGRIDRTGDESELQVKDFVNLPMPKLHELGTKDGKLPVVKGRSRFMCCICNVNFDNPEEDLDEDEWVFCPCCYMMSHSTCIKVRRCICGFKPLRRDLM